MSIDARKVLDEFYDGQSVVIPVDVVGIANSNGIRVYRANFEKNLENDVFGFITNHENGPRIYVNAKDAYVRRRFTTAHELGHFFLHHNGKRDLEYKDLRSTKRTSKETEANRFAEELLMPEKELKREHEKLMFPTAERLAEIFQVSKQAMTYRLRRLGLPAVDI